MSASLVGSEMCIRDSPQASSARGIESSSPPGLQGLQASSSASRPRPCLLYTSDAADDMQCVDLG
eukprot:13436237-Alexandrium_andersonii.AAC.1